MNEMVERVAKAIAESDGCGKYFEQGLTQGWEKFACAAITAMRESTPEMLEVGSRSTWRDDANDVWHVMIDEALKKIRGISEMIERAANAIAKCDV